VGSFVTAYGQDLMAADSTLGNPFNPSHFLQLTLTASPSADAQPASLTASSPWRCRVDAVYST
jgi:hypothetical protein